MGFVKSLQIETGITFRIPVIYLEVLEAKFSSMVDKLILMFNILKQKFSVSVIFLAERKNLRIFDSVLPEDKSKKY